jgi:hypothetical protein
MQRGFDPHGIVEITLTSTFYVMSARTTRALGLQPEKPPAGGTPGNDASRFFGAGWAVNEPGSAMAAPAPAAPK